MLQHIISSLDYIKQKYPTAGIAVIGDFNHLPDRLIKSGHDLKQIVTGNTHENSMIDLVYTNMHRVYKSPIHLSPLGLSKHHTILVKPLPSYSGKPPRKYKLQVPVMSSNNRTFFAQDLREVAWDKLYKTDVCQKQCDIFYSTISSLLQKHFPLKTITKSDRDKPWVTPEFRELINKRELAWQTGETELWKEMRNRVNRQRKQLASKFYKSKVECLKSTNPSKWWKNVKFLTGNSKPTNPLSAMMNHATGGNAQQLADEINNFFSSITQHLEPLTSTDYGHINIPDKYQLSVPDV